MERDKTQTTISETTMKLENVNRISDMSDKQWSIERVNEWYAQKGWLLGCNFAPSTAANQLEMWEADSFDPATIDRELGWAHSLGFNSIRVFLHHLLWEHDAEGLKQRM